MLGLQLPPNGPAIPSLIESFGDRFRRDSCDVFAEDPLDDRGFSWLDLSLTRRHGPTTQRLHYAVSVTQPAARLTALDAPAQPSMRLVCEILQEQRVHRPLEPDVQVCDVAFGECDDVHAGEGEALEEPRGVFLVAAEAVK